MSVSSPIKRGIIGVVCVFLAIAAATIGIALYELPDYSSDGRANNDLYQRKCCSMSSKYSHTFHRELSSACSERLWSTRDSSDSCHYLMIPMHYAFYSNDEIALDEFDRLFSRFAAEESGRGQYQFRTLQNLDQLHFLYLVSQYLCLCDVYNRETGWENVLMAECEKGAVRFLYTSYSNWRSDQHPIENIREILDGGQYENKYLSVITDDELFALAILCDMASIKNRNSQTLTSEEAYAAKLACEVFQSDTLNEETSKGGWLLQPGMWSDHPDYAYAGNESITSNMSEKELADAAWDTSHFSRMPLFLMSYERAQVGKTDKAVFQERRQQLANQMVQYVLKQQDGYWLTTTFMDGINGVYRYSSNEDGAGVDGYELSGTFCLGWWVMLHDSRISQCYEDIAKKLPISEDESNPYFEISTTIKQTGSFDETIGWTWNWYDCTVECAAAIGASDLG